jgi:hypothetical protein
MAIDEAVCSLDCKDYAENAGLTAISPLGLGHEVINKPHIPRRRNFGKDNPAQSRAHNRSEIFQSVEGR